MSKIRKAKHAESKLKKLESTKNLKEVCEILLDLVGSVKKEKEVVSLYDKKTGIPIKYKWVPYEKYSNKFSIGSKNSYSEYDILLDNVVLNTIRKNPILVNINNKYYVCRFEEIHYSSNERDVNYNWVTRSIVIEEVNKI